MCIRTVAALDTPGLLEAAARKNVSPGAGGLGDDDYEERHITEGCVAFSAVLNTVKENI